MTVVVLGVLLACQRPAPKQPDANARSVRLRAFAATGPMGPMVATEEFLFVATQDGIDRVHLASGEHLLFGASQGLPGTDVYSLAATRSTPGLWVATDAGIARLDVVAQRFDLLPASPEVFAMGSLESSVMASAADGGLWIGSAGGLFFVSGDGHWRQTGIVSKVSAIQEDASGSLWIAADEGLFVVGPDHVAQELDVDDGCDFAKFISLALYRDRGVLALAEDRQGRRVVAVVRDNLCTVYPLPEEERWTALVGSTESYLLSDTALWAIIEGTSDGRRPRSDELRAVAVRGDAPESLALETVLSAVPTETSGLAVSSEGVFLRTASLGVLLVTNEGKQRWLRRRELSADAHQLSVACAAEDDCYVALGNYSLWHWDGTQFEDEGLATRRSHFVMRLADGRSVLLRDAASGGVRFFLRNGRDWQPFASAVLQTPGQRTDVRSVRQAPDGLLWISLGYYEGHGDPISFGVAAVDLELGAIWYHRASFDEGAAGRGILPVPVNVSGIAFLGDDEIWLASSQGASRVVGDTIKRHTEGDGLLSEILSAVVCSSGGMVYTASGRGVGQWDGQRWSFPADLRTVVHDLVIGLDGNLWLATERGIGIYDGERTRRLDVQRGLLENNVEDLESDHFGRIWARSAQGLVLITP